VKLGLPKKIFGQPQNDMSPLISELMFFDKIAKLNRDSIAMTENISIVLQLFLSLIVKSLLIKKVDFSEFRIYTIKN
jgi:hypothetical protein